MGSIIDGSRVVPCHYCQREVGPGALTFTRDHVVPRAMGGKDRRDNVVPSCRDCNGEKADKYPTHDCSFCQRTRRRHWEEFGIGPGSGKKLRPRKINKAKAHSEFERAQAAELKRNKVANARAQHGQKSYDKVGTHRGGWVKTSEGWVLERLA